MNTLFKRLLAPLFCAWSLIASSLGAVVTATFNAASDIPVTSASYTATGNTIDFALNFAPPAGTNLTVINNTGLPFIQGVFGNLPQGQVVNLTYGGLSYAFVANYYGGTGNDLVLHWANVRLLAWGSNTSGALGDGFTTTRAVPVAVIPGALAGKTIVCWAAGSSNSLALAADGTLAAWGGTPGDGVNTTASQPVLVSRTGVLSGKSVVALSSADHRLVLSSDGTIAGWGSNTYGQLGNGTTTSSTTPVAVNLTGVLAGKTVVAIAAGSNHSLALCSDGTLAAWGRNDYGQLGNSSTTNSNVPVLVNRTGVLSGKTVSKIDCGGSFSVVLCTDGTLVSWGYNSEGELGNGSTTQSTVPVLVNRSGVLSGKSVTALAVGGAASVVLCSDGTLATWGHNAAGQLGNGTTTQSTVPVLVNRTGVLSGKTVAAISAGDGHAAALCKDGTLASWGSNFVSALGNNSTTNSSVPVAVDTGVLSSGEVFGGIQCGFGHNLALGASPPVPVITTLAATVVRNSTATLNGNASANGTTTALAFEYGTTTAYGKTVTGTPAGLTGTTTAAVSADLTDLAPGATYHFRMIGTSSSGTVQGNDMAFTTNTNAILSSLAVDQGTLTPTFSAAVFHYELVVPPSTASVRFTPMATDAAATVRLNGIVVARGAPSEPVPLAVGSQTLSVEVAAADGINTCNYAVTVIRRPETFTFNNTADPQLAVSGLTASGPVKFALNFAPLTGASLTVVNNKGIDFIQGTFDNLAQGQRVDLTYGGVVYAFVANYYGGSGNDLILQWANNRLLGWGANTSGMLGNGSSDNAKTAVAVDRSGVLAGKTIIQSSFGTSHQVALCSDGSVMIWGSNTNRQFGNNSSTNGSQVPTALNMTGVLAGRKVVSVAAAGTHTLALCSDGRIAVWGTDDRGALGTNSTTASVPTLIPNTGVLANKMVVAIATGPNGSMALCSDGTVAAWGYSTLLGADTGGNSLVPVGISMTGVLFGKKVVSVQMGSTHCLVLCEDGSLIAWGSGSSGQLGSPATFSYTPVLVDTSGALAGKTVTSIAVRESQNFVMCSDGTVVTWGSNSIGQLGIGSKNATPLPAVMPQLGALAGRTIVKVVTGFEYSAALCQDLTIASWGRNNVYQFGNGTTTDSLIPVVPNSFLASGERVVDIYGGNSSTEALVAIGTPPLASTLAAMDIKDASAVLTGSVSANGSDTTISFEYGLTAAYGMTVAASPALIAGTTPTTPVSASIGGLVPGATYHYRIIATSAGGVVVGNDTAFTTTVLSTLSGLQTDTGTLQPSFIPSRTRYSVTVPADVASLRVTPVTAYPDATVAVNGMPVGSGAASAAISLPVGNTAISIVVTTADGLNPLTYLLTATRLPALFSFNSSSSVPVTVEDFRAEGNAFFALNYAPAVGASLLVVNNTGFNLNQTTFANLAQGQKVSLSYNGVSYCYVADYFGGTGNDLVLQWANNRILGWGSDKIYIPTPVDMTGVLAEKSIIAIASGDNHRLALCSDGTLTAWGNNGSGQLGNKSTTSSVIPVKVDQTGLLAGKTVIAVEAGFSHTLVLCSDGTLASWGRNSEGQLGNGTTTSSNVPIAVTRTGALSGKTVRAIAAGTNFNVVLCTDGSLISWGDNGPGSLGNGTNTTSSVPVLVNQSGVLFGKVVDRLSASGQTARVLCTDGTTIAWGYSGNGQLGSGSYQHSSVPVLVDQTGVLSGKSIASVGGGNFHGLALCSDGTLAVWGDNQSGQLGLNVSTTQSSSGVPVLVYGQGVLANRPIVAMAGGAFHTLALCSDGTMLSWGGNDDGELGDNTTVDRIAPVLVNASALRTGERVTTLSAGSHSLALVASPMQSAASVAATNIAGTSATLRGSVNANGNVASVMFEYGTDTTYGSTLAGIPSSVSGNGNTDVTASINGLAPGTTYHFRVVATNFAGDAKGSDLTFTTLSDNAKLASLGSSAGVFSPAFDKLTTSYIATVPFGTTAVTVTPTTDHSGATVKVNGSTVASGTASGSINLPIGNTTITTLVTAQDEVTTKTYTLVITRLPSSFVFNSADTIPVTAAGFSAGNLPVTFNLNFAPVPGTILTAVNNTGLAFINGRFSNLAQGQRVTLSFGGTNYDFVANYFGGTGNDLVLQWANTKLFAWGSNSYGQLGDDSNIRKLVPTGVNGSGVLAGKTITAVAEGYLHSLVLCSDGTLAAWGYNAYGQLGNNSVAPSPARVAVDQTGALAGKTVVAISAGPFHNLALCSDGSVAAWGYNNYGQLGTGDKQTSKVPVMVKAVGALSGKQVTAVAAAAYSSFALCSDGSLVAWGYNDEGELGDGTTVTTQVPVAVTTSGVLAGKKIASIAAGQYHTLALCTDGTLVSWGYNKYGQLGNNTTTSSQSPVNIGASGVLAGKTVVSVRAGKYHSLALCADGTVAAWGANTQSQLGMASGGQSLIPVAVNMTGVTTGKTIANIAVGANHCLALLSDGTQAAWGDNGEGQLGNNSTVTSAVPSIVDSSSLGVGMRFMLDATSSASLHNLSVVALPTPMGSPLQSMAALIGDNGKGTINDDDHDGIPNLVEYAFGLNPLENSAGQLPKIGSNRVIQFSEPPGVTGIIYGAESSTTLLPDSWMAIPDTGTGTDHVFTVPADAPKVFFRLKVTRE